MAESASIKKMSPRHEAILVYILANPTSSYSEVAAYFGVTRSWLSTIIHSQAFQDQLARRQNEIFDAGILQGLEDKLSAAAHLSLDHYLEKIPTMTTDQLISSTDKVLGKLGFGSKGPGGGANINAQNVQINYGHVPKEVVEAAREKIGKNQVGQNDSPPALPNKSATKGAEVEGALVRAEGA